ncbi:MAG TPA: c-type cytochrome, partial [Pricia sp.]|nr:c-type cytochrome [Pricia sp.]
SILPSEVFLRLEDGSDAGWPYHYYNQIKEDYFLNPEYGGNGKKQGENVDSLVKPLIGFPGHFAPNDLLFYTGDQFPERYKNGAFMAFHGSTSSAPYPQTGYFIGFVPMEKGMPSGPWEVFADGFAGVDTIINTSDAKYRPMGLAMGPDGSIYVSDSEKGKIWRVLYKGDAKKFGEAQLAKMAERKKHATNIKTPDEVKDIVATEDDGFFPKTGNMAEGARLYNTHCALCHQKNGRGNDRFPPLNYSDWVSGDTERLIDVVLNGLEGEIMVHGKSYNNVMPKQDHLKDEDIALILTYIRQNFGNRSNSIDAEEVAKVRNATGNSK